MYKRIALVKTGWSDLYEGEPVLGRHAHIAQFEEAHERFNFRKHSDGRFYAYIPPIGPGMRPPQPTETDEWLVLFVAARNGTGRLTVVGWYEQATFGSEYLDRPEYLSKEGFPTDVEGKRFSYCISSRRAHLIPTANRTVVIAGTHFKRSPILYLRGGKKNDSWRRRLAGLAAGIVTRKRASREESPPTLSFPDPQTRKRVELAAIRKATAYLKRTHHVTDRQSDKCGYDLLARNRKTGTELHVEVKGTSTSNMHFYLTRNEFRYMANPKWRLAMVTNALSAPKLSLLGASEVNRMFALETFAWEATIKSRNGKSRAA